MRLSQRSSFLIIVIVASLLVGGLIGFYFYTKSKNKPVPFLGQDTSGKSLGYSPSINSPKTSSSTAENVPFATPNSVVIPKLRQITDQPISGADFVFVPITATTTRNVEPPDLSVSGLSAPKKVAPPKIIAYEEKIRWIERGTGHVYETSTSSPATQRLSNTTITRIQEAFFTNKGDSLIIRDLIGTTDTIRTRLAKLNFETPTSTEQVVTTTDLPVDIIQITRSPDRSQLISIMDSGMRAILSNTDGSSKVGILDIPFKEWLVHWPNKTAAIINTKPSGGTDGYAYSINPQTKAISRLLGGIPGLTTLGSPDMSHILYNQSDRGSIKLYSYNKKTNSSTDLFLRSFTDKCVWSTLPSEKNIVYCGIPQDIAFNIYPDAWYQGKITFSDSIWSINVETSESHLISNPLTESSTIIDITNPTISSTGSYMLFQNKIDLSLWGLKLKDDPKPIFNPLDKTTPATSTSTPTTTATSTVKATTTKAR